MEGKKKETLKDVFIEIMLDLARIGIKWLLLPLYVVFLLVEDVFAVFEFLFEKDGVTFRSRYKKGG